MDLDIRDEFEKIYKLLNALAETLGDLETEIDNLKDYEIEKKRSE